MKKTLLFALLLTSTNLSPLYAVQVTSQEEDDESIKRGRNAKNVCHISVFFGKDENGKPLHYLGGGTGALIESDLLVTAGHVIHNGLNGLLWKDESKAEANKVINELKMANPIPFSGLVTFEPNVHEAMLAYENSQDENYLSRTFYEVDSVIVHPSYNYDDGDAETDLAFVKLKKHVEGIAPLALYKEGIINPLGLHKENDPDLSMLIRARFSGYGTDVSGQVGKKRTVSQLCFVSGNHDDSDNSSASGESDYESNENSLGIEAYIPSTRQESNLEREEKLHNFHDGLCQMKKEGEVYGFLHKGDSGGPLIVNDNEGKEFVIGIESTPASMGEKNQEEIETFQEVRKLARDYVSYLCPLFNLEGKLRPEIPIMIEKLRAFPALPDSNLKQFVQTEKAICDKNEEFTHYLENINSTIGDMNTLLNIDFNNQESDMKIFEIIENKYKENKEDEKPKQFSIDLNKAKTFLQEKDIVSFKLEINIKIEKLGQFKKEVRGF